DGDDVIGDTGGSLDVLRLGTGITDAWLSRDTHNLYVQCMGTNAQGYSVSLGRITLANWFDSVDRRIERIELADGRTIGVDQMQGTFLSGSGTLVGNNGDDFMHGNSESDLLQGLSGNDWLNGGSGNDTLEGGTGNDLYVFDGWGSGQDVIVENDATAGNVDTIQIMRNPNEVLLTRTEHDLILSYQYWSSSAGAYVPDGTDRIVVSGWFDDAAHRVERIELIGTVWDVSVMQAAVFA
ncbi:MAG TPA: calcium-binding protein, partial [Paucimonas sp.]|nr:calcium-binding protein [Paucimonas sp.]